MLTPEVQVWINAFFTLGIFSLVLYGDNKVFRVCEALLIGVTAANGIVLSYHNYIRATIVTDILEKARYSLLIPILIGLLMYARLTRRYQWLSRIPSSLWIGVGAGYAFSRGPALTLSLVKASFLKLDSINNVVFVIGLAAVVIYFYFTVSGQSRIHGQISQVGRTFMLIFFGARFATGVMGRVSLLLGRLQFLLYDWLKVGAGAAK
ncbi:MAG: hypothetical protein ACOX3V_05305 [Bacillota bacterium]|jgi:hypothetical protein